MVQVRELRVDPEAMVRSQAWREGYAEFRRGERFRFIERGTKALAYEYGRQTAAFLLGGGRQIPWISDQRPLPEFRVAYLSQALRECAQACNCHSQERAE